MVLLSVGIVVGLVIATFVSIILVILKDPIETKLKVIYETIPKIKEKGDIIQAETEIAQTQRHIIEENKKQGRDTRLADIIIK